MRAGTRVTLGKVLTLRELGTARACRPLCILDPLREEVPHPATCPAGSASAGLSPRRIDYRIVFDKIVMAVVFGCAYARLGDASCSATTLRRRRDERTALGVFDRLRRAALDAYATIIEPDLADVAVDGWTNSPCGGECARRGSVDRASNRTELLAAQRRRPTAGDAA